MARAVILIGIAPSPHPSSTPFGPSSRSGAMLMDLGAFESWSEMTRYLWPSNLIRGTTTATRKTLADEADAYPLQPNVRYVLAGYEVVRAFGNRAMPVTGRRSTQPLDWYRSRSGPVMAQLPHPSGRNRWYNDRENRKLVRCFLFDVRAWVDLGIDTFSEVERRSVCSP